MTVIIHLYLETPLVLSSPLHLDSLLAAIHPAMSGRKMTEVNRFTPKEEIIDAPLPFNSAFVGKQWVWLASAGIFPDNAKYTNSMHSKSRSDENINNIYAIFNPSAGRTRNRIVDLRTVITPQISFTADVAFLWDLRRLLKRITFIGGKRNCGYGKVSGYDIEQVDIDWKTILIKDTIVQRRIPDSFCTVSSPNNIAVNPPYWSRTRTTNAYEVGETAELLPIVMRRNKDREVIL